MRNYCLNVNETAQILKWRDCDKTELSKELSLALEEAQCWTSRITCITLFLARILEREKSALDEPKNKIAKIYAMNDELFFEIQETDHHFVEFLLGEIRNPDESLEEALIEIQNRLSGYDYEKSLRY